MKSLLQLFSRWASWLGTRWRHLHSQAKHKHGTGHVAQELVHGDLAVRFIYSRKHMSEQQARPKAPAFYPPHDSQLSVVHSTGLQDHHVWEIGILTLGTQPGRDKIH